MATRDPERYFDRRTITRHLKRGHVSEGEFTNYVETLPDVSDKIKARDEGGDDDGFDGRGKPKSPAEGKGVGTSLLAQFGGRPVITDDDDDDDDDYDDDYDDDVVSEGVQAQVAQAPSVAPPVAQAETRSEAPPVAQADTQGGVESVPTDSRDAVEYVPAVPDHHGTVETVPAGDRTPGGRSEQDVESAAGSSSPVAAPSGSGEGDIESGSADTRGDDDRGGVQP